MRWSAPKIWKGGTCWIIGGGSSITKQFRIPDDVVQQVRDKKLPLSAFSPYMSILHDKHVIGVNSAFLLGDWIDICFFGDKDWFFDNKPELDKYKGLVVGCPSVLKIQSFVDLGIKYVEKNDIKEYGISEDPSKVCWNKNSGAAAISLAFNLGCKRIILLGFDMQITDDKKHWHVQYDQNAPIPFAKHLVGFGDIASDAERLGIEILNCNPDSAIPNFKKIDLEDLIWKV